MTIEMLLLFLVKLVIILALVGGFLWVLWWGLQKLAPAEPFMKIGQIVLVVVTIIIALLILLWAMGALGINLGTSRVW